MRIAVMAAGAVGGYFGARMAAAGHDVAFIARGVIHRQVNVIATIGGTPPALVAKAMTSTIPIVFYSGVDVVRSGLVASLNRPGGNLTGIAALQAQLIAKRIELLSETLHKAKIITLLVNPSNRYTDTETEILYGGARSLDLELHVVRATSATEFDAAFKEVKYLRTEGFLVSADLFLYSQREKLVSLVNSHALPTIYPWREFVTAGGLTLPNLRSGYGRPSNSTTSDLRLVVATKSFTYAHQHSVEENDYVRIVIAYPARHSCRLSSRRYHQPASGKSGRSSGR